MTWDWGGLDGRFMVPKLLTFKIISSTWEVEFLQEFVAKISYHIRRLKKES